MEQKLNIAELLKDCPSGMELYSPLCGVCYFDRLNMGTIICKKQNTQEITFTSEGYYMLPIFDDCECVLFPSKECRCWSKFQRPFKDGDVVVAEDDESFQLFLLKQLIHSEDDNSYDGYCYFGWDFQCNELFEKGNWEFNRLATEEEKRKLFDTIKAKGYKWNEETKALEKLPKFKVKYIEQELIEKACSWLDRALDNFSIGTQRANFVDKVKFIESFKKAMEK